MKLNRKREREREREKEKEKEKAYSSGSCGCGIVRDRCDINIAGNLAVQSEQYRS
jgi:hypothetical protein